jgi:hypothetical protein
MLPRAFPLMRPLLLVFLLALRIPSLVQPAGGDQGLYGYEGQRILHGDVLYRDVWDQKPPGIAFLYAGLQTVWPHESIVPAADLAAAAIVAWLLVVLGCRRFSANVGYGAASLFLLLGDPGLQRLSGIYVRGQCEPFIALAVTAALVSVASRVRSRWHLVLAGTALAAAFWLKYNAAAYALPLTLAVWLWRPDDGNRRVTAVARDSAWTALGFAIVSAIILLYMAATGALHDLRLATIDYNIRYSDETYASPASLPLYLLKLPITRARVDMLWFLGGIGSMLLLWQARANRSAIVSLGWLAAVVLSIAINGQRDLPNYFVQANPALGLAAAAGLATIASRPQWVRYAVGILFVLGLWRVGADAPVAGMRLAGLPGLLQNLNYDFSYARGRLDRATYLRRFKGVKHDALEIDQLSQYVRETTGPAEPVFVFGFSGGSVCWKSERVSASRFFWSYPVIIEFAAGQPGYGSAGLLDDLRRRSPVVVALQREQWQSERFFLSRDSLRTWLDTGYVLDHETPMFAVWRRKS